MTLEDYLRKQTCVLPDGKTYSVIDYALRCEFANGYVRFYIHPANCGGDTQNFEVHGNALRPDRALQSTPGKTFLIWLNGRDVHLTKDFLSYDDICELCLFRPETCPSCIVEYKGTPPGFSMHKGSNLISVQDGMIINCMHTNNA